MACALSAALMAGCASPARLGHTLPDASALARDLNALTGGHAEEEARKLAETAIQTAQKLAVEYRSVRPAWFHNVLVNAGWRERGLCFQWAHDLKDALDALHLRAFVLHWAVARYGTTREHNAIVVTAVGQPFEQGIVLDAWRKSGVLCWAPVRKDKYPWREMTPPPTAGKRRPSACHRPPGGLGGHPIAPSIECSLGQLVVVLGPGAHGGTLPAWQGAVFGRGCAP